MGPQHPTWGAEVPRRNKFSGARFPNAPRHQSCTDHFCITNCDVAWLAILSTPPNCIVLYIAFNPLVLHWPISLSSTHLWDSDCVTRAASSSPHRYMSPCHTLNMHGQDLLKLAAHVRRPRDAWNNNNSMKIMQYITLPMCSPSVTQCTVTIHIQTWTEKSEKFIAWKKCYNAPCSRINQIHPQLSSPTTKTIGKLQCFCIILKPTYISPQMLRHKALRQEMNEI